MRTLARSRKLALALTAGIGVLGAAGAASAGEWLWDGYAWRYYEGEVYNQPPPARYHYDGNYYRPGYAYYTDGYHRYYVYKPSNAYHGYSDSYTYWPTNGWYSNYRDRPYTRQYQYNQ